MLYVFSRNNLSKGVNRFWLMWLVWGLTGPVSAELLASATLVETVNGLPMTVFHVLRQGEQLDVTPMMPLYEGDQVYVLNATNNVLKDKQNYINLRLGDQQLVKVTDQNSPYLVAKADTNHLIPSQLLASISPWFKSLYQHSVKIKQPDTKIPQRDDFTMPLLAQSKAQLITGERSLHLAWQGGKAPYWVQVFSEHDQKNPFLIQHKVPTRQLQFEKRLLVPGYYRVIVISVDGSWRSTQADFHVVKDLPSTLQKVEAEIQASSLSKPAKQTMFAAWLAQTDNGEWQFEAYQRIVSIAATYQPALLIKEALEKTLKIEN